MALSATTVWELRTTGDNNNGCGFDSSLNGTDYSQQDSPQVTYTDLAVVSPTAPSAPTLTATTGSLSAGTHSVKVAYYNGTNVTYSEPSSVTTIVLGSSQGIIVTSPSSISDATQYAVWAQLVGFGSYSLIARVNIGTNYTITSASFIVGTINSITANCVSSAAFPLTPALCGNNINVSAVIYQIKSVFNGVAELDKTGLSGTGISGKLGGAALTAAFINTKAITGNVVHWKTGSYSITVALAINGTKWYGYSASRFDDGTPPTVTTSSQINLINASGSGTIISNVDILGFVGNFNTGLSISATNGLFRKITVRYVSTGINVGANNNRLINNVVRDVHYGYIVGGTGCCLQYCYGQNCDNIGIQINGASNTIDHCFTLTSGGSGNPSYLCSGSNNTIINCTSVSKYSGTPPGAFETDGSDNIYINCLATSNSSSAFYIDTTGLRNKLFYCARYNTPTSFVTGTVDVNISPITLTSDPFNTDYSIKDSAIIGTGGIDTTFVNFLTNVGATNGSAPVDPNYSQFNLGFN